MNFFKRAIYSITRKKGKSLILLVIIFILGNIMAGSVAIKQATENVENNIKTSMGGSATVEFDHEKFFQDNPTDDYNSSETSMSEAEAEAIGNLPEVKYYDYNNYISLTSKTLTTYTPEGMDEGVAYVDPDAGTYFSVMGVQYPKILAIEEGGWKVTGRTFTDAEIANTNPVAVIGSGFAEQNNLSVGDSFVLTQRVENYYIGGNTKSVSVDSIPVIAEREVTLEVVGIYEPELEKSTGTDQTWGMDMTAWTNYDRLNGIYVTNGFAKDINEFANALLIDANADNEDFDQAWLMSEYIYPTYILNSPDVAEDFKEKATALLRDYFYVNLSSDGFEQIAGSLYTMRNLANIILYVAIAATILILTLLIILFLRDRKHELGVYLSLGEKRSRVLAQVFIEIFIVAFVGISASLITGNLVASAVSESMLISQMEADQASASTNKGGTVYYSATITNSTATEDDILANYEVKLTLSYVLLIYGIGLGTVLVAVVGPMIYIMRLNPKKIMM